MQITPYASSSAWITSTKDHSSDFFWSSHKISVLAESPTSYVPTGESAEAIVVLATMMVTATILTVSYFAYVKCSKYIYPFRR